MKIEKIEIENFKGIDSVSCNLSDLNVMIVANASGKTNFVKIFEFFRKITQDGIVTAYEALGGEEYFFNVNKNEKNLELV